MDKKLKHLEFLQNIISRMAHNSFLLKGWAVTLTAALFALSKVSVGSEITLIAVFLIGMFWTMDAYFLHKENIFRQVFDEVRQKTQEEINFSMVSDNPQDSVCWFEALVAPTLLLFYGTLLAVTFLFGYFL